MANLSPRGRAALFAFGSAAILAGLCVTAVPETSQAVVLRMGEPVRVINRWSAGTPSGGGGLLVHLPLVEQVEWVERGLFGFTSDKVQVRTVDDSTLNVDAAATLRVFDPVKLVSNAGTSDKAIAQLTDALRSLAPQELGQTDAQTLLRPGSGGTLAKLRAALDARARQIGVQVVDLRLTATALPEGALQQTYERMEAERARMAAIEIENGNRDAERIVTQARTDAARMMGAAASQDPEFYQFHRAMRSYERVFASEGDKGATTIILGPDNEYLKQFEGR